MVDVFISYSRANQAMVRQLADAVKREGYSIWWDDELPPHLSYGDVITEKIGSARAAIVVWSQSAAQSEWVRAEADVARGQKKLIQTSIDDRMPPMPFNQIQFASIGDWRGEADHPGWLKVKASLAALCGPGAGASERAPAYAMPTAPPPTAEIAPPAAPAQRLIVGALALLALVAGAAILLLWLRSDPAGTATAAGGASAERLGAPGEADGGSDGGPIAAQERTGSPSPEPSAEPARGEILADSGTRPLIEEDLEDLSKHDLFLARNEVFARHGRPFRSPALRRHFAQFPWYRPRDGEIRLSAVEAANVRLIWAEEQER